MSCQFCTLLVAVSLDDEKVGWGIFTLDQVGWLERKVCAQTLINNNASSIATPLPDPGTATPYQSLSWTSTGIKKERQPSKYLSYKHKGRVETGRSVSVVDSGWRKLHFPRIKVIFCQPVNRYIVALCFWSNKVYLGYNMYPDLRR